MRLNRKLEHIELSLEQCSVEGVTGFNDITLVHNPLPQLDWEDVDASCVFLGKQLKAPLLINAMTGGHPQLESINHGLARAAAAAGVALAVGSQRRPWRIILPDPALLLSGKPIRTESSWPTWVPTVPCPRHERPST